MIEYQNFIANSAKQKGLSKPFYIYMNPSLSGLLSVLVILRPSLSGERLFTRRLKEDMDLTPDNQLPYPDPAVVNPEELATFPKRSQQSDPGDIEDEKESHLVNKRSPLREGRNITRTDNNPDNDGFM